MFTLKILIKMQAARGARTNVTDHYSTIITIRINTIINYTDSILKVNNYDKLNDILV